MIVSKLAETSLCKFTSCLVLTRFFYFHFCQFILFCSSRFIDSKPPFLFMSFSQVWRRYFLLLLLLGHSFEEPSSRFLPHFSALSTDLAEPSNLLWCAALCRGRALHPALCADRFVAICTQQILMPCKKAECLPTENAVTFTIASSIVSHVLQSLHESFESLFFRLFHLLRSFDDIHDHLLFRSGERVWLFPLIDCCSLH